MELTPNLNSIYTTIFLSVRTKNCDFSYIMSIKLLLFSDSIILHYCSPTGYARLQGHLLHLALMIRFIQPRLVLNSSTLYFSIPYLCCYVEDEKCLNIDLVKTLKQSVPVLFLPCVLELTAISVRLVRLKAKMQSGQNFSTLPGYTIEWLGG